MRDKVRNKLKKRKAEEDEDDSDRMKTKERLETRLVNKKGRHHLTLGSFIGKWKNTESDMKQLPRVIDTLMPKSDWHLISPYKITPD